MKGLILFQDERAETGSGTVEAAGGLNENTASFGLRSRRCHVRPAPTGLAGRDPTDTPFRPPTPGRAGRTTGTRGPPARPGDHGSDPVSGPPAASAFSSYRRSRRECRGFISGPTDPNTRRVFSRRSPFCSSSSFLLESLALPGSRGGRPGISENSKHTLAIRCMDRYNKANR